MERLFQRHFEKLELTNLDQELELLPFATKTSVLDYEIDTDSHWV